MLDRWRRARRHFERAEEDHDSVATRGVPSLARDAVVLAIDARSGVMQPRLGPMVVGALLLQLVQEGRLEVSGTGKYTRVTVRDSAPLGDEQLDDTLLAVDSGVVGTKVTRLARLLPSDAVTAHRLQAAGAIEKVEGTRWGIFTAPRYVVSPTTGRDELAAQVRSALVGESVADDRTALLISILGLGVPLRLLVPRGAVREAYRRAEKIEEGLDEPQRAVVRAVEMTRSSGMGDTSGSL